MLWFKILSKTGRACHGGTYKYDLPKGNKPGAWTLYLPDVQLCSTGYHVTNTEQLLEWDGLLRRTRTFIAQVRDLGTLDEAWGKAVCKQIRLLREIRPRPETLPRKRAVLSKARRDAGNAYAKSKSRLQRVQFVCNYIERKMGWKKSTTR